MAANSAEIGRIGKFEAGFQQVPLTSMFKFSEIFILLS